MNSAFDCDFDVHSLRRRVRDLESRLHIAEKKLSVRSRSSDAKLEYMRRYHAAAYENIPAAETVYIVSDGRGRLKVGFTRRLSHRLKQLRTAIPDLQLVADRTAPKALETAIHRALAAAHIDREWYHDTEDTRRRAMETEL